MNENLPGGHIYTFGLFLGHDQIGFQCFANYVPWKDKSKPKIYHSNRTVIHPDYQGFGLGMNLINETSKYMVQKHPFRIMAKFSSEPIYRSMSKNPDWHFLGVKRKMNKMNVGGNMIRQSGFREKGTKTYSFEFKLRNI